MNCDTKSRTLPSWLSIQSEPNPPSTTSTMATALALAVLTLVWIVYPAIVAIIAIVRRCNEGPRMGVTPSVSIVLASRDEPRVVKARIRDLLRSDYPGEMEIVVGRDGVLEVEQDLTAIDPAVRVTIADAPGGKAMAINAAVRLCRGEILVFADTHQRFSSDTVAQLVGAFRSDRIGAVSGRLELPPGNKWNVAAIYWRFERWLRQNEAALHSTIGVTGAIWAMRRSLWEPLPAGLILDDVFTPLRLIMQGRRVAFCSAARALEIRSIDPAREYTRKVRTLTGVVQVCAWMPSLLLPWRNPVWLQFFIHKVLRLLTPYALCVVGFRATVELLERVYVQSPLLLIVTALLFVLFTARSRGPAQAIRELILIQGAVVVATMGGMMGRWNVWRR